VDQDGNGCADDVIGYDFYDGDPNPAPSEPLASGTHGSGVQNAVTDNAIGVAAPPWNVRSFAARCGSGGSISLYAAIAAIYYLVPAGVWSFSMPFGSASPSQPLADACLYAWDSGTIPCAPAGTDGTEVIRYPAGYPGVLAIAAHGRDNRKSPFSNYGTWIDFTAPGVDILATAGPDGYEARSGTSVACNIVVGILGWLKSAVPDISRDSAVSWLRNLCDTMPDPLYWQGKLGAGRVRMSRNAVGAAEQREPGPITAVRNSVCRGVLVLAPGGSGTSSLLNPAGRQVLALHSGPNDVSSLAPGVYFVRSGPAAVTRVVLLR